MWDSAWSRKRHPKRLNIAEPFWRQVQNGSRHGKKCARSGDIADGNGRHCWPIPLELGRPLRRRRKSGVDVGYRRVRRGPQPSRNRWRKRLSCKDFIYMRDGALVHCNGQWISRGQAPLEILRNGGSDQGAGMIELERKPPALAVEMQFFAKQLVLK